MLLADRLRQRFAEQKDALPFNGDDIGWSGTETLVGAAVLIPIVDRIEPGIIFTRRTAHLRKHAGQVAFPGGRIDPGDEDAVAAALREAQEEIGLAREQVSVVGLGSEYRTGTGFLITPVIAVVPPDLPLTPHAEEVDAIFEVPLAHVMEPANYVLQKVMWQGRERSFYEIMWNDQRIWGATASMLLNLAPRLQGLI